MIIKASLKSIMVAIFFIAVILIIPSFIYGVISYVQDTTVYSSDYTETKFDSVGLGMTENEVIKILGLPLDSTIEKQYAHAYYYEEDSGVAIVDGGVQSSEKNASYSYIRFDFNDVIDYQYGNYIKANLKGDSLSQVIARYGQPNFFYKQNSYKMFYYTSTHSNGSYNVRNIGFDKSGNVNQKVKKYHQD